MPKKNVNQFGVGLFLGALFGYAVSYFTASKPGEELQEDLSVKADQLKSKTREVTEKIKNEMDNGTSEMKTSSPESPEVPTLPVTELSPEEMVAAEKEVKERENSERLTENDMPEDSPVE